MVMVLDLRETMRELLGSVETNPFLLSFLFLSFLLLVYRIFTRGPKLNLPPSPPKLPIIGNIHQIGKLPHRSITALARKYGPVMLLHFGGNPTVIVSSVEAAREMTKTHDIVFSNKPRTTAINILFHGDAGMIFTQYGEHWRQAKKICVLELFSHKRVQSFQFVREEEASELIGKIRSACVAGSPIDLGGMLIDTTANIIMRCAFGRKFEEGGSRSEYGELVKTFVKQFTAFSFGDFFRPLAWLDNFTGFIPRLKATVTAIDAMTDQVIEEHKSSATSDEQFGKKDLVDVLLRVQESGMLDLPLTQDNIKAILLDMFIGGAESSSSTAEWAMTELVKNPHMMKKAQDEVRGIVGKGAKVERDDVDKMNYLKCVVKETLRFHPSAPFIRRATSSSVKLAGYDIPANTDVLINVFAMNTDPKLWDRPEEFLPDRFEEEKIFDFQDVDFQFFPFGVGRRRCPGITFGVASITYLLANLLYWFDWKLPGDGAPEDLDMTEVDGLTITRKVPLCLVPALHFC